jgi:DNA repair protein RecO (recombination protein O)
VAVYKSRGIVLRSIRYGEADRILDLYTADRGLVSVIAKGIRRTKSRFGARLEPLACVEFLAYEGRSLDTITQVETLNSFHRVREHLPRFEAAGGMVAAVRALSGGDEADRRVFNLLYHGLSNLEDKTSGFSTAEAAFGLKLSTLAGYAPELEVCINCNTPPEDAEANPYFAPSLGGVLCSDCRAAASDSFPLAPATLDRMRTLISVPLREATDDPVDESTRRAIRAHLLAHAPGAILSKRTARPA